MVTSDAKNTPTMTLEHLRKQRDAIIVLAEQHGAYDVRVFGSIVRGESSENSDIDLLVTFKQGSSIFDQVGLWQDLQDLLGCAVDLLTDHPEAGDITARAKKEAVPL